MASALSFNILYVLLLPGEVSGDDSVQDIVYTEEMQQSMEYEQTRRFLQQAIIIIGGYLIFVIIISWVDAKYLRKNDFYRLGLLISVAIQILDTITDLFLIYNIAHYSSILENKLFALLMTSIFFFIAYYIISIIQLYQMINKHWKKYENMRLWLSDWISLLYVSSLFFGSSLSGVHLRRSNLFGLSSFDMPLSKREVLAHEIKKLYPPIALKVRISFDVNICIFVNVIVSIQNISQTIIAAIYLDFIQQPDHIAYISITFSVGSIAIIIISWYTTRELVISHNYCSIEFDVTAPEISSNFKKYRNNGKKFKSEICKMLRLNSRLLQMARPTQISNGLRIHIDIYCKNDLKGANFHRQKMIISAHENGELKNIIKDAWKLSTDPVLSNFKSENAAIMEMKSLSSNMYKQQLAGPGIVEPGQIRLSKPRQTANKQSVDSYSSFMNKTGSNEEIIYVAPDESDMRGYFYNQTKLESAVHLDIIKAEDDGHGHDVEKDNESDNDSVQKNNIALPSKLQTTKQTKHEDGENKDKLKRKQTNKADEGKDMDEVKVDIDEAGAKEQGDVKEKPRDSGQHDVLLDGMLSDVLKMQSIDPNKIHQLNIKEVDDNKNQSDTDNSDDIYENSNDDKDGGDQDEEDISDDLVLREYDSENEDDHENSNERDETEQLITSGKESALHD